MNHEPPLLVIVGPTASGKTSLAIRIAQEFNGEVISADSRAIYKGFDIGTAKPSIDEQGGVRHWGIDIVEADQRFTVADFKQYAERAIKDIRSRGKLPIIAGGTGLYIDAVIFDYQFPHQADESVRSMLEQMELEELYEYCKNNNVSLPENDKNKRYVINAILRNGQSFSRNHKLDGNTIVVGISTNRLILKKRIIQRAEQLFNDGVVKESMILGKKYDWNLEAMKGNIYPLVKQYIDEKITMDELKNRFISADYKLAKRQLTWFNRNPYINWLSAEDAYSFCVQQLASRLKV